MCNACGLELIGRLTAVPALMHRSDEAVASPRDRLDVLTSVLALTKGLPQLRNILGQVSLFNKSIRPDLLHKAVLCDNLTAALNEREQHVEDFWGKRDDFLIAKQQPFSRVYPETAELIKVF